ncbi:hypothetical protein JCM10207_000805 [Rhodosporidiobolus poonsookiae]
MGRRQLVLVLVLFQFRLFPPADIRRDFFRRHVPDSGFDDRRRSNGCSLAERNKRSGRKQRNSCDVQVERRRRRSSGRLDFGTLGYGRVERRRRQCDKDDGGNDEAIFDSRSSVYLDPVERG